MTQKESQAINIAHLIFVVGVLFIHFPISYSSSDGVALTSEDIPVYNLILSSFFLSSTCLQGLFLLSGVLVLQNRKGDGVFV